LGGTQSLSADLPFTVILNADNSLGKKNFQLENLHPAAGTEGREYKTRPPE
jgi:hypothetical protein